MTYKETLDWMFAQLPMYQQKGKSAFNAKLDKSISLASFLGNPEHKFKSVHVAGTNGKGSSSHMLASILQAAGYKTGLYTSPHLNDFRERIRINGKPAEKDFVVDFIAKHKEYLQGNQLSFFEMTVGMAFDYFAENSVDIAIIEVGLGGRLDSTNIIIPEVSLITNIGLDHVDMLGDTLEKIAIEKAGIIKEGVPVVISEFQEEIAKIFHTISKERNAEIIFADKIINKEYKTSLLGSYQIKNIKGVVATIKKLDGFEISETHIEKGLANVVENTGLLGRWQVLDENPMVICDTAHNKEGLSEVLVQLKQQKFNKLHIVLGFVKDKNLDFILPLFPKDADYYFTKPDIPRGLEVLELIEKAEKYGLEGVQCASVKDAFAMAKQNAMINDFIFIGGSTFVVAEVV
ncbi:folylpolyglutamate synthase/dihydrofolate synthase family protein [Aurantibacter sp.]|uniref:bifunctional folylpolyglutamate synthase/dihydrofolate synthase n=1 Tax=Aurantibacter sp. TaxID=2807103 RepID=UPI00326329F5